MLRYLVLLTSIVALTPAATDAQHADSLTAPYPADRCARCAGWNAPRKPFRVYGNTYFVGTEALSAVLITSAEGHVLIDGGLPNTAPLIIDNIRSLGFDVTDVKLILNSHTHYDHAGGIAALQRASGARVAASSRSADALEQGSATHDDPQHGEALPFPRVRTVERFPDGAVLTVGSLSVTAYLTAGHTPGGTSWSWESCDSGRCLRVVYADSQTPLSADGFRFSSGDAYPTATADFERGLAALENMPCDILVTPHPGASSLWKRMARGPGGLIDSAACRRYAATAREQLETRLKAEASHQ